MLLPLPWVCQMMPPCFCSDMILGGFDGEILVDARQLLDAAIKEHKIMHQLNQALLFAHFYQVLIQLEDVSSCSSSFQVR